ncbi:MULTISPECIES: transposase [unclassified Bradyrhizobium]
MSATARRNGLSTSQLFTWRRLAREGRLGGDAAPLLVPVEITSTPTPASAVVAQTRPLRAKVGIIEIELSGCRVRGVSTSSAVAAVICSRFFGMTG